MGKEELILITRINKKLESFKNKGYIKTFGFNVYSEIILNVGETEGEFHTTLELLSIYYYKEGYNNSFKLKTLTDISSLTIFLSGLDKFFKN